MQNDSTDQLSEEIRDRIECKVKWFNTAKGFGFVEPLDGSGDAFVHISVLQSKGLQGLPEGAPIVCDLSRGERGQQVQRILNLGPAPALQLKDGEGSLIEGTVKFFNSEKGFGFVTPDDASRDIFVHMKALEKSGLGMLEATQRVRLNVKDGEKGPLAEGVELL
ncbi:cold-shock protein [Sneathiella chinensis]|uniref:Cold-shock protein n=1 Tax=Sneathiella chinensis TaxID=349750 RepID=A0ABQ5U6Y7_9PROT|nr:cold-shock protein [Sneathiella chinensis]